MSLKRKCFSVEAKMKIIQRLEAGERNITLAKEFCVCHTTIATIKKDKEKIKALFNSNVLKLKRARVPKQDQVDKALLQWFTMQRSRGIPLSGPLLQEKANFLAKELKIENFNCSASWISRFKIRHNIVAGTVSGKSLSVQKSEWLTKVWPALRKDFSDDEIFNADETGLFYKLTPDKTLKFKGENCIGGKLSKERITVLVAANMSGNQKKKLLVIGKSQRPRCFKNVQSLPVVYHSNRRAWITSQIFINWIRDWNAELKKQKKKILLLVDNCPAHPTINDLSNVTLVFLPPNTISVLQPMDQGIIRAIKSNFRKNLLLKIIGNMEENDENYDKITILDAILMINDAWQQLPSATIANCFKHSGLAEENLVGPSSTFLSDSDEDDIPLSVWVKALRNQLPMSNEELNEYVVIDNNVAICGEVSDGNIGQDILFDGQDSDENVNEQDEDESAPSVLEAFKAAEILNRFVHSNFKDESLTHSISRLNNAVRDCYYRSKTTIQSKITDYLN